MLAGRIFGNLQQFQIYFLALEFAPIAHDRFLAVAHLGIRSIPPLSSTRVSADRLGGLIKNAIYFGK